MFTSNDHLKNPAIWLVKSFKPTNSRTRFFLDMWMVTSNFLQYGAHFRTFSAKTNGSILKYNQNWYPKRLYQLANQSTELWPRIAKILLIQIFNQNGQFWLNFKILSLVFAENVLKCAPYCRKSDYTIHVSRKTLVLEFSGSKLSTNQIAGFFKWSLLVNRLIFFSETLHEVRSP